MINPQRVSISVSNDELHLTLSSSALWYQASQGVLVHKTVQGNLRATTQLRVRSTAAPSELPMGNVQLAGLMLRDPAPGDEDYVFVVLGQDENDLSVETKSTDDSVSTYEGPSWSQGEAQLRICRVGSEFVALKRASPMDSWETAQTWSRPDLPDTLQIGLNIYTASTPDITAHFEFFRVEPLDQIANCAVD